MKKQNLAAYGSKKSPPAAPSPRICRLLDLPGFRALEIRRSLYESRHGPMSPEFDKEAEALSQKTFGLALGEPRFPQHDQLYDLRQNDPRRWELERERDDFEEPFEFDRTAYDEKAAYMQTLGWDFTDDGGELLQIADLFARQAEAVSKKLAGRMPDFAGAAVERWEEQMAADARRFRPGAGRHEG